MNFGGRRGPGRSAIRWLWRAAVAVVILCVIWFGGLLWFSTQVPSNGEPPGTRTDAIVVLTGGTGRLEMGLQLLEKKYAKRLFVSGVAHGVDVAALLRVARRTPKELECCISVGYRADDTAGNADETAEWVTENGIKSIRLVTANYHMPRSLIEFRRAMPSILIVPHPVYPRQFKRSRWWLWPGTAALLASEFNKYIIALFRQHGRTTTRKARAP